MWETSDYVKFLQIYWNYEILYNIKCKEYTNKTLKHAALEHLRQELKENGKLNPLIIIK